jgi:hypothetical protein
VDVLRWHALEVDIGEAADRRAAIRSAGLRLEQALHATPSHLPLAVRVTFTGRSAAHAELIADEGQLRQEIVAQAVALDADRLWIEKVRVASEPAGPGPLPSADEAQGALAELATLALAAGDDPGFVQALQADWLAVLERLPHDVLQASPELHALRHDPAAQITDRLRDATPVLIGRVARHGGSSG